MKKKRYQEGGEAEGISGTAGRMRGNKKPRSIDDMSFGQAFKTKLDELGEGEVFTWRGKKYTTDTKKPAAKSTAKADDTPATGRSTAFEESRDVTPASEKSSAPKKKKTFLGALASRFGTAGQRKRGAEEGYKPGDITKSLKAGLGTQRTREELADEYEGAQVPPTALMTAAGGAAGMGGRAALRYGARRLGGGAAGRRGESLAQRRIREAREAREARLDEKLAADMEGGFRRGGGVKKYNKGGKIDGIAKRGKTRCRII
jgi:hypothetical protein